MVWLVTQVPLGVSSYYFEASQTRQELVLEHVEHPLGQEMHDLKKEFQMVPVEQLVIG